jgi:cell division transport system permease protein
MAFLSVFALALSLATGRLAERWGDELAQSATIRITASAEDRATMTAVTLRILESTPGVAFARALEASEQQALLAPWFGPDFDLGDLPVPQLIEVLPDPDEFDPEGLKLRLEAEVPGAVFDDHGQWREPLLRSAARLRALAGLSLVLIAAGLITMVTLAAHAALAANSKLIKVLRLVGATDGYIAQAFVRRFTQRAVAGAAVGTLFGAAAVAILPSSGETGGLLTGLGLRGAQWALMLLIPIFAGLAAFFATRWSAQHLMGDTS